MNAVKKHFFALSILFVSLFSAGVAECQIPLPFRIGGTVTVDGSQLIQGSDSGYTFVVTRQNGNDFNPGASDTDGLNSSNWYVIDIPIYDPTDQPGGANPGDTAVIHVYRNGQEFTVTSPANGSITVGNTGSVQQINLIVESSTIPPTQYQLTASVIGGNGSVSPTSGWYNEGTVVTLIAIPNSGYRVAWWSGTNNDNSTSNTNSVTMNSNRTVTVGLEEIPSAQQYTLTASVIGGNGSISPTSGIYDEGTVVTLTATPNSGYRVAWWSGTNNDNSTSNTNSVTMNSNRTVTVGLEEIPSAQQYTLTASVSGGNGSISPTSGIYDEGTVVTLTAMPNSGYRVASWTGTDNDSSTSNTNTVTMNSNKTVTVSFKQTSSSQQYRLVTAVQGGGGTLSPTIGTYDEGTVVQLTASPHPGYHVALWSGTDNDDSISEINYVTMNSDRTVVVLFNESEPVIESFAAIPSTINQGDTTSLSWSIIGADSASINNGIGSVDTSQGSISVSPDTTTIYTLTATNSWGNANASVSVTVEGSSTEEDDHDNDGIPDSEDPDDDNDGLSDLWEQAYGLDPLDSTGVNGKYGDLDDDGWSNQEEYEHETDPSDSTSVPSLSLIQIVESIPNNLSGINDNHRVPHDAPFSLRIEAFNGIDITNTTSIRFTIDDSGIFDYTRDLSDTQVVKVINLTEDPNTNVGHLWVTYYKSLEPSSYPYNTYPFDTSITIKVEVVDREGFQMAQAVFNFGTETEAEHEVAQEASDLIDISSVDPEDPDLEGKYDAGIQVDSGDLAGARIIYNSDEPLKPTFGSSSELPPLDVEGLNGVGIPMILQPAAVFRTPVRIFIPCPEYSDLSELCVMLHNGEEWIAACDENGEILPGGEGWMVPGSRVNHNNGDPSTIEIQVYHFSAVQAATDATTNSILDDADDIVDEAEEASTSGNGSSGGCFIGTAAGSFSNKGLHMDKGNKNPVFSMISVLAAVIAPALMGRLWAVESVYINGKYDRTQKGKRMINGARSPG